MPDIESFPKFPHGFVVEAVFDCADGSANYLGVTAPVGDVGGRFHVQLSGHLSGTAVSEAVYGLDAFSALESALDAAYSLITHWIHEKGDVLMCNGRPIETFMRFR